MESASASRSTSIRPTAARKAPPISTCTTTRASYGLRTVVFRMSCIYGPRQFGNEDQGWVAHFMLAVAGQRPLDHLRRRQTGARPAVRRRPGARLQTGRAAHRDDRRQRLQHRRRTREQHLHLGRAAHRAWSAWQVAASTRSHARLAAWRSARVRQRHAPRAARLRLAAASGLDDGLRRLWAWAVALEGEPDAAHDELDGAAARLPVRYAGRRAGWPNRVSRPHVLLTTDLVGGVWDFSITLACALDARVTLLALGDATAAAAASPPAERAPTSSPRP